MSRPFHFKEFSIYQKNAAMKVGTDAVLLGAWAKNDNCKSILDIGCGTGLISLMMAQRFPEANILSIDIDEKAIEDAKYNFSISQWNERIALKKLNLLDIDETHKFDLIVCNPPFFESDSRSPNEHRAIARSGKDLSFITWINKCRSLLNTSGVFAFVYPIVEWNRIKDELAKTGLNIQRICEIKPTKEKPAHRVLVQLSINDLELKEESEIIIEHTRHVYTDEYIALTRDFYLKMA